MTRVELFGTTIPLGTDAISNIEEMVSEWKARTTLSDGAQIFVWRWERAREIGFDKLHFEEFDRTSKWVQVNVFIDFDNETDAVLYRLQDPAPELSLQFR